MKTNLIRIASLAVVALGVAGLGASRSSAASYTDKDEYSSGGLVIGAGTTYTGGNFNITSSNTDADGDTIGYNPLTETLTSAFVSFEFFSDAGDITKQVVVKLDSEDVSTAGFDGTFSFVFGDLIGTGWVTLKASGILDFSIQNNGSSDIRLNNAILIAERGDGLPSTSVPDAGATAILFGTFSLAALAIHRRLGKVA